MEFFFEMLLTALLALLCSFLLANLVSSAAADKGNDPSSDDQSSEKPEIIGVGDEFVTEEVLSNKKMDARVMGSDRNLSVVADENVELVDRFVNGADGVAEVEDAATGNAETRKDREEELVVFLTAEAESTAVISPENNAIVEEEMMISRGEKEEESDSAEEIAAGREEADEYSGSVSPEEKIVLQEREDRSESTELGRSGCVENEESGGDVVVAEVEDEVRVEETNTVAETEIDTEGADQEKEELSIEEDDDDDDDDWEGIERSELEKSFAAAANLLQKSGKSEDIGAESKMDLYGLHKIATEGPCREPQPMAVMVSARAKWNAWQKLGNMSQEEAIEQYLALVSKEVPGLMTVGKMSETVTSVCLPPNSGTLEDPTNLDTTAVDESRKMGKGETSD
ncbi:PREDICTED: acyl-CoA-binding domain-containing protein 3-like isoform X2 [Camelina sativa]|uniref:Acyl-CoA-binding domain-containing protein 3-like isoform X2 n=1 Tax=Camelina sativa TaxID=90675 RepID=A0ABM1QJ32_CAMSA|nr:PREDICTED: acyl-CoA-binding domain-containing protein 3-like isoform X2 [Camelina sativa]